MKIIWIINHYATNMFFAKNGRHVCFARRLQGRGYSVKIFCASTRHNNDVNLITDSREYYEDKCNDVAFVFIKTRNYKGNGKQRVLNMIDFYRGMMKASKHYKKPDVIIGSSVHPLASVAAIRLAKRYKCKAIVEIRDLWPKTLDVLNHLKKYNFIMPILYKGEKWMYKKANQIVFTMEGGKDYIIEKGWDKTNGGPIDIRKVYYINNGVDLQQFDINAETYVAADTELDHADTFKVVYTGTIRKANGLGMVISAAKLLQESKDIQILIWGTGDEETQLRLAAKAEGLKNIYFKGSVNKEYIPSILKRADLNLHCLDPQLLPLLYYGGSFNKLFEYLAARKPVLSTVKSNYSLIQASQCGIELSESTPECLAEAILAFKNMTDSERSEIGNRGRKYVENYDFKVLTEKLIQVIDTPDPEKW